MKRWTIKELKEASNLKFAACILSERRAPLNQYAPMAQKLGEAQNLLLRLDSYMNGWGSEALMVKDQTLDALYRDGYHSAARMIEKMVADRAQNDRERDLLNNCFAYFAEALPGSDLLRVLREKIGLTDEEISKYQMDWLMEEQGDGEAQV